MDKRRSIDIDDEIDFELAEFYLKNIFEMRNYSNEILHGRRYYET
jgi:hypothetical protein